METGKGRKVKMEIEERNEDEEIREMSKYKDGDMRKNETKILRG